jgi:ATP-dependent DNA helicase RecG
MAEQFSFNLVTPETGLVQLWTPDEIYDRLNADNVAQFAEDRRVERKSTAVQPKTMAEYLSMWSNTQPHGGIILVGLDDNGRVSGCKQMPTAQRNALESLTHLCSDARWVCKNVALNNHKGQDDFIIMFRVTYRPDKLVETSSGDAFIREGDKKLRLSEAMKRELRISKGEIHYELESTNAIYPDDFDPMEISKFCQVFAANRRYPTSKTKDELLVLAKLGRIVHGKFKPNLACSILFSLDPRNDIPGARIRVIRYEGTQEQFGNEMNSVFSTFVDGNVSKILFEVKPIVASQIRTFQRFTMNGKIISVQEYPEEAWFEAIVNAVAHRSYNFKTQNIFVKIFDDKFVVESPRGFVPPTTGETVYDAHNPRNPYLMEAMMHLELTFCGFEGTRRMRSAMQKARLPEPRFRQIEAHSHQVHVTL